MRVKIRHASNRILGRFKDRDTQTRLDATLLAQHCIQPMLPLERSPSASDQALNAVRSHTQIALLARPSGHNTQLAQAADHNPISHIVQEEGHLARGSTLPPTIEMMMGGEVGRECGRETSIYLSIYYDRFLLDQKPTRLPPSPSRPIPRGLSRPDGQLGRQERRQTPSLFLRKTRPA